jgi:dihydroorotate dehydrogenase
MLYHLIRPLLFRFDAERAHDAVFRVLGVLESVLVRTGYAPRPWTHPRLAQRLWGIDFPNPVGLAAGLDKNARAPHVWPLCGFGSAELGTVTAHAQPGNPKPRLFRVPRDRALINRMGFNNDGAAAVARRLGVLTGHRPSAIPIGINLGKSRVTALDDAVSDYVASFRAAFPFASYVVINVSSPNTPGLRDLQAAEHLAALLAALTAENTALACAGGTVPRPLLVKLAPDLSDEGLADVVRVARAGRAAGLIATNTTVTRSGLTTACDEAGGLSGAPLRARALAVVGTLHRLAGADLPIVGVGGIASAADAYAMIRAGASLVQLYTGLIYDGPRLPVRIARGLVDLLRRDGFAHVSEAVGSAVP